MNHKPRLAALALAAAVLPAVAAPEGYVIWDDFAAVDGIDETRWLNVERVRHRVDGALRMGQRDIAGQLNNTDMFNNTWSTFLKNPSAITQMRVTITAESYVIEDCAANTHPEGPPDVQARAIGAFFNASGGVPSSRTDDVVAGVRLIRRADSPDAAGVMRAEGFVARCTNADCNYGTTLVGSVDMGPVNVGTPATMKFDWEPDKDRFNFYLGSGAVQRVSYAGLSDAQAPYFDFKVLSTRTRLEACMLGRKQGVVFARFDNLSVNSSAAP